jgi:hypothetical protein
MTDPSHRLFNEIAFFKRGGRGLGIKNDVLTKGTFHTWMVPFSVSCVIPYRMLVYRSLVFFEIAIPFGSTNDFLW